MSLLLSGRDTAAEIAFHTGRKADIEANYTNTNGRIIELRNQFKSMKSTIDNLVREEGRAQTRVRELTMRLTSLRQEAEEELPVNVGALEEARRVRGAF